MAKFKNEEVSVIRKRRDNGELLNDVYLEYKDRCGKDAFRNIWNNITYKNVE